MTVNHKLAEYMQGLDPQAQAIVEQLQHVDGLDLDAFIAAFPAGRAMQAPEPHPDSILPVLERALAKAAGAYDEKYDYMNDFPDEYEQSDIEAFRDEMAGFDPQRILQQIGAMERQLIGPAKEFTVSFVYTDDNTHFLSGFIGTQEEADQLDSLLSERAVSVGDINDTSVAPRSKEHANGCFEAIKEELEGSLAGLFDDKSASPR